ncbi:MAG TPA: threonine/serine dehydratase [Acidocella sp.]|nr:threonine/serine dehydratase [Acidocella sp.]
MTPQAVHEALIRIAPHVLRTPMLRNAALDRLSRATILIKPEVLQRTGSFKLRGATNALMRLSPAQRAKGVVTYSSGNHGQAIACAAGTLGMPATIVMPADAPAIKRESTAFWGAKIIEYDRASENREAIAQAIVTQTGATLIPPYEHPDVIAGQGTAALELFSDVAAENLTLDALLVPTGGGGLVAGCALALSSVSPSTKIYSVEPEGWDDTARSLISGQREHNDMQGSKFCDALLTPTPGELTFSINKRLLTAGLVVSDAEVKTAQFFAARHLKLTVEPGGAVALAALLAGRIDPTGKTIGVILSGGNAEI